MPKCTLNLVEQKEWEPVIKDGKYSIHKIIGRGSYGNVAKALCLKTFQTVAIKRISNFVFADYPTLQVLREIQVMKELNR